MQLISDEIKGFLANSSWIRKMFEAGIELKKQYGNDQVFDFSLGNPDLPPPPSVKQALEKIAGQAGQPFSLGYMPNAGYDQVRARVAAKVAAEQDVELSAGQVVMSCGAAGGINALFRAILTPGDEVVCPAPYFVEYDFYAGNYGAKLHAVPTRPLSFELDLPALAAAITPRTRAFIINSPNNPTGQIYSVAEIAELGKLLAAKSAEYGRVIYLISDEPYRFLNFDGVEIPSVFRHYQYSIVIGSFSKTLSLGGERIGYVACNPAIPGVAELVGAVILTTRILGYVNAPAVAQKILLDCLDSQVDLNIYRRRRDVMAEVLTAAGIEFTLPRGAFYFFPKSPTADENIFIQALLAERVLAVPGRGFGCAGYFRLTFCMDETVIRRSADGFRRAVERIGAAKGVK